LHNSPLSTVERKPCPSNAPTLAELAAQGHLNERGKAFAAKSVASMLAG
jgi:hypothetical protein